MYGTLSRSFDINPYSYSLNTSRALGTEEFYSRNYAPFNILYELDNNYIDIDVLDVKLQGHIKWKPIKGLEITGLAAFKYGQTGQHEHVMDHSNRALAYRAMDDATMQKANRYLYTNPDNRYGLPVTLLPGGGFYQRTDHKTLGYDFRITANYVAALTDKSLLNVYGGMDYKRVDKSSTWFNGWGMEYDMGMATSPGYLYFKSISEDGGSYYSMSKRYDRDVAFYLTPTFSYDGRYSVTGVIRYEGSNKLGKSRSARWMPTWNISGAWNIHEESFFQPLSSVMSHLKFKLSYSLTADRGPAYVSNSLMILKPTKPYRPVGETQETGLSITYPENSELTYEKKHEFNIGLETGFLDGRIEATIEYYKRKNFDLIGIINTEGVGGFTTKYANSADMDGQGVDFSLSTKNIKTKDFSWNTNFIFGYTETEVKRLDTRTRVFSLISGNGFTMEGYPHRGLFSIPFVGLDKDGLPLYINEHGKTTTTAVNLQETIKKDFLKYEGPTDPTITGSLGNNFKYKNFTVNLFITYAFGNVVRLDQAFKSYYTDLESTPKEFTNRWVLPVMRI